MQRYGTDQEVLQTANEWLHQGHEVALVVGEDEQAWDELRPLVAEPEMGQDLLRIAIAGLADSGLPGADPGASLRRLGLSVRICRGLLGNETLPRSLEPRAHDTLVRSMLAVLDNEVHGKRHPLGTARKLQDDLCRLLHRRF